MINLDWNDILVDVKDAINSGCDPTIRALSRHLEIPYTTLHNGLDRNFMIQAEDLPLLKDPEGVREEQSHKTTMTDTGMVVEFKGGDVRDLDEMLERCKVDLDVWKVDRYVINKYPGMRRNEQKDLTFEDGKIVSGYTKDQGELTITQLFQIKVWLVRKIPLQPEIVIQPVEIRVSLPSPRPMVNKPVKTAVIIPDMHVGFERVINTDTYEPFHDRRALDVAVQLVDYIQPDRIVILGDTLDMAEWTDRFLTSPEAYWTTQSAVIEAAWWLGQMASVVPNAKKDMLAGNHEDRLHKAIVTHLKAAYNLKPADELDLPPMLSIERLLGLPSLGISYTPEYPGTMWLNKEIACVHGNIARAGAGATAKALIANSDVTVIQGHIHRIELVMRGVRTYGKNKTIYGFSPGCLCRTDGVVPGYSGHGWQNAIGVVHYTEDNHHLDAIPINDGAALWDGAVFTAENRMEDMIRDTGWDRF